MKAAVAIPRLYCHKRDYAYFAHNSFTKVGQQNEGSQDIEHFAKTTAILPSAESKIVKAKSKIFMVVLFGYTGLKEAGWVVWFWLVNLCEGSRTKRERRWRLLARLGFSSDHSQMRSLQTLTPSSMSEGPF